MLDVGCQLARQARRWLPDRDFVLVGDSGISALLFLDAMRRSGITAITRLRLDAALYEPAPPRPPGTIGRPRTKGTRLPNLSDVLADARTGWQTTVVPGWYGADERTIEIASATAVWRHGGLPVVPIRWVLVRDPENRFAPQALLCTDLNREPVQIVSWLVRLWNVEVTFREARVHLGVKTQPQSSDKAIARTTPCLLALFSIVTLLASRLPIRESARVTTAAWYVKRKPTLVDALAAVRYAFWREQTFVMSHRQRHGPKRRFILPAPGPTSSAKPHNRPKSSLEPPALAARGFFVGSVHRAVRTLAYSNEFRRRPAQECDPSHDDDQHSGQNAPCQQRNTAPSSWGIVHYAPC